ncbi:MAG: hypothetical protein H0U22_15825 [Geodermatophilaceae bacterium]|nr:hypothetical protein [Geodermatophilaceae bacterium]
MCQSSIGLMAEAYWFSAPLEGSAIRCAEPGDGRPGAGDVLARDDAGREQHRYDDTPPLQSMAGDLEGLALYAGQSVGLVHSIELAARIVERIVAEAEAALTRSSRIDVGPGAYAPES